MSCSDGVDNDGDGFTDCEDFSCTKNPDVSVCNEPEDNDMACSDDIDNDGDGFTDCDDFDCAMNPMISVC